MDIECYDGQCMGYNNNNSVVSDETEHGFIVNVLLFPKILW